MMKPADMPIRKVLIAPASFQVMEAVPVIILLSLIVKLGYIVLLGGGLAAFPGDTDGFTYDRAARSILEAGTFGVPGYASTQMPPGESALLALIYGVTHYSIAFAKLAQITLLTLVAIIIYFTVRKVARSQSSRVLISHFTT